jgi:Mrp family chromosome partitioning ATPase
MNTTLNLSATAKVQPQVEGVQGSVFHTLLYTVFQKPRDPGSGGIVVAIGAANPGEGVSFVTRALLHELSKCEFNSVAGVNTRFLRKLHEPTLEAIRISLHAAQRSSGGDERVLPRRAGSFGGDEQRGLWEGSWQYRRDCIDLLRSEFDHSIIDCPSLKVSGDLLSIAPFVDGVLLVIAANRTHRDEPRQAEQCVAAAGGKLLGCILNKRTDEMPRWLDRML